MFFHMFLDVGEFGVVLDLFTRLDIAIDVSHALTYLHLYAGWSMNNLIHDG